MRFITIVTAFAVATASLQTVHAFSMIMASSQMCSNGKLSLNDNFQSVQSNARLSSVGPLSYRNTLDNNNYILNNAGTAVRVTFARPNQAKLQEQQQQQEQLPLPTGTTTDTESGWSVVQAICLSQVVTLALATGITVSLLQLAGANSNPLEWHWNFSSEYTPFFDFSLSTLRVLQGVLATLPMVYLGRLVETSDQRDESRVNFSTMNMVMTLFGRRKQEGLTVSKQQEQHSSKTTTISQVLPIAAAIAIMTGISEELVFRGELPTLLSAYLQDSMLATCVAQAALFGICHFSSKASLGENRVVCGLQTLNGLWYGLIYMATGGDVLPCIIAHCLYDSHVLVETWMSINEQMDYTQRVILSSDTKFKRNTHALDTHGLTSKNNKQEMDEIKRIQKEAGPHLDQKTLDFTKRFFFTFDYEHRGSLSRSDVQRAVSYAFLADSIQPTQQRVDKLFNGMLRRREKIMGQIPEELEERLRLPDFLRVLFVLKSKPQATA